MTSRVENVKRNYKFAFLNKIVLLLFPFIIRATIIKTIGIDYIGINSLFASILSILSLAELGFGSAIVFCMYKPISENDDKLVCSLLNYYKRIYRKIGIIILIIGLMLIPFLPHLINGSYPKDINITIVYIIFLLNTVTSYLLFSYYTSMIIACQRNDIVSKVNMGVSLIGYLLQIFLLFLFNNYYIYIVISLLITVFQNIIISILAKKYFPNYFCKGELTGKYKNIIRKKVLGLLIGKIQYVSRNGFDSVFISMFLGLTMTAKYNNYYYIFSAIIGLMQILITSITASVGNSVAKETVKKNYNDMKKFNFLYMILAGWATTCLFVLYQPFMTLWMGKDLLFPFPIVVLFCVYFYSLTMGDIRAIYLEVNGLWWENRYKCLIETICNIVLNYILGKYFGIYGIVLATILTILIINFGYGTRVVYTHYFKNIKISEFYLSHLKYFIITAISIAITFLVSNFIQTTDFLNFIFRGVICVVIPPIIYGIIYLNCSDTKEYIMWIYNVIKKKSI